MNKLLEKTEYIFLLLMAVCIPLNWRWASYVLVLLCINAVAKVCINGLPKSRKECLETLGMTFLFASFFFIYLLSVCWSDDKAEAWRMVDKKLPFLLFPLWLLFSRPMINQEKLNCVLRVFTWSVLAVFVVNFVYAAYEVGFCGANTRRFFSEDLMKIHYVHHSYMAMYACLGIAFSLFAMQEEKRKVGKILQILVVLLLTIFILLLESRAGLLTLFMLVFLFWCHLVFGQKRKKLGIATGVATLLIVSLALIVAPSAFDRLLQTVESLSSETMPDCRTVQAEAYRPMLRKSGLCGYGCGDRIAMFTESFSQAEQRLLAQLQPEDAVYKQCLDSLNRRMYYYNIADNREYVNRVATAFGCDSIAVLRVAYRYLVLCHAQEEHYNAHNQYNDTLVATGYLGLAALLLYFLLPLGKMFCAGKFDMLMLYFLLIIAFNALFESVFERQLGVLFFLFFFFLFYQKNFSKHVYPSRFCAGQDTATQAEFIH